MLQFRYYIVERVRVTSRWQAGSVTSTENGCRTTGACLRHITSNSLFPPLLQVMSFKKYWLAGEVLYFLFPTLYCFGGIVWRLPFFLLPSPHFMLYFSFIPVFLSCPPLVCLCICMDGLMTNLAGFTSDNKGRNTTQHNTIQVHLIWALCSILVFHK